LEVGGGIKLSADGTVSAGLPGDLAGVEVGLGAEVAVQYGVSYGKEETFSKSLTVVTEAGTNMQFTIQHIELWETGELVITIGEWQQPYPYKFRRGFGLEQVDSRELGCPTSVPLPTYTSTPRLPSQTPTETSTSEPPTLTPTNTFTPEPPIPTPTDTPTPVPATGTDWHGEYFANDGFKGSPAYERADAFIDFDWGTANPAPGVGFDRF